MKNSNKLFKIGSGMRLGILFLIILIGMIRIVYPFKFQGDALDEFDFNFESIPPPPQLIGTTYSYTDFLTGQDVTVLPNGATQYNFGSSLVVLPLDNPSLGFSGVKDIPRVMENGPVFAVFDNGRLTLTKTEDGTIEIKTLDKIYTLEGAHIVGVNTIQKPNGKEVQITVIGFNTYSETVSGYTISLDIDSNNRIADASVTPSGGIEPQTSTAGTPHIPSIDVVHRDGGRVDFVTNGGSTIIATNLPEPESKDSLMTVAEQLLRKIQNDHITKRLQEANILIEGKNGGIFLTKSSDGLWRLSILHLESELWEVFVDNVQRTTVIFNGEELPALRVRIGGFDRDDAPKLTEIIIIQTADIDNNELLEVVSFTKLLISLPLDTGDNREGLLGTQGIALEGTVLRPIPEYFADSGAAAIVSDAGLTGTGVIRRVGYGDKGKLEIEVPIGFVPTVDNIFKGFAEGNLKLVVNGVSHEIVNGNYMVNGVPRLGISEINVERREDGMLVLAMKGNRPDFSEGEEKIGLRVYPSRGQEKLVEVMISDVRSFFNFEGSAGNDENDYSGRSGVRVFERSAQATPSDSEGGLSSNVPNVLSDEQKKELHENLRTVFNNFHSNDMINPNNIPELTFQGDKLYVKTPDGIEIVINPKNLELPAPIVGGKYGGVAVIEGTLLDGSPVTLDFGLLSYTASNQDGTSKQMDIVTVKLITKEAIYQRNNDNTAWGIEFIANELNAGGKIYLYDTGTLIRFEELPSTFSDAVTDWVQKAHLTFYESQNILFISQEDRQVVRIYKRDDNAGLAIQRESAQVVFEDELSDGSKLTLLSLNGKLLDPKGKVTNQNVEVIMEIKTGTGGETSWRIRDEIGVTPSQPNRRTSELDANAIPSVVLPIILVRFVSTEGASLPSYEDYGTEDRRTFVIRVPRGSPAPNFNNFLQNFADGKITLIVNGVSHEIVNGNYRVDGQSLLGKISVSFEIQENGKVILVMNGNRPGTDTQGVEKIGINVFPSESRQDTLVEVETKERIFFNLESNAENDNRGGSGIQVYKGLNPSVVAGAGDASSKGQFNADEILQRFFGGLIPPGKKLSSDEIGKFLDSLEMVSTLKPGPIPSAIYRNGGLFVRDSNGVDFKLDDIELSLGVGMGSGKPVITGRGTLKSGEKAMLSLYLNRIGDIYEVTGDLYNFDSNVGFYISNDGNQVYENYNDNTMTVIVGRKAYVRGSSIITPVDAVTEFLNGKADSININQRNLNSHVDLDLSPTSLTFKDADKNLNLMMEDATIQVRKWPNNEGGETAIVEAISERDGLSVKATLKVQTDSDGKTTIEVIKYEVGGIDQPLQQPNRRVSELGSTVIRGALQDISNIVAGIDIAASNTVLNSEEGNFRAVIPKKESPYGDVRDVLQAFSTGSNAKILTPEFNLERSGENAIITAKEGQTTTTTTLSNAIFSFRREGTSAVLTVSGDDIDGKPKIFEVNAGYDFYTNFETRDFLVQASLRDYTQIPSRWVTPVSNFLGRSTHLDVIATFDHIIQIEEDGTLKITEVSSQNKLTMEHPLISSVTSKDPSKLQTLAFVGPMDGCGADCFGIIEIQKSSLLESPESELITNVLAIEPSKLRQMQEYGAIQFAANGKQFEISPARLAGRIVGLITMPVVEIPFIIIDVLKQFIPALEKVPTSIIDVVNIFSDLATNSPSDFNELMNFIETGQISTNQKTLPSLTYTNPFSLYNPKPTVYSLSSLTERNVCGDSILFPPEQCEQPNTNNNPYCENSPISMCLGYKTAIRDVYGFCNADCTCNYDAPARTACVKNSCNATCSNDLDCSSGKICNQESCSCINTNLSVCGDGIVQHPNSQGFDETCDGNEDFLVQTNGYCKTMQKCVNCRWLPFHDNTNAREETCNGIDEDCNGVIDDFKITECSNQEAYCSNQKGVCRDSKRQCMGILGFADCTKYDYNHTGKYEITETKCDHLDNDCDGAIDEGCDCVPSETRQCGYSNFGACKLGMQTCDGNGNWGTCVDAIYPNSAIEAECNGIDDDCDGIVDECLKNRCGECGELPVEICDYKDNNCNAESRSPTSASFNGKSYFNFLNPCPFGTICKEDYADGVDNNENGFDDEGIDEGVKENPNGNYTNWCEPTLTKSKIQNTGNSDIEGYVLMKVQKLYNGAWNDVKTIVKDVNQSRKIKGGEFAALDTIWKDAGAYQTNETGVYRVYSSLIYDNGSVMLTSNHAKLEGTHLFSVVR